MLTSLVANQKLVLELFMAAWLLVARRPLQRCESATRRMRAYSLSGWPEPLGLACARGSWAWAEPLALSVGAAARAATLGVVTPVLPSAELERGPG